MQPITLTFIAAIIFGLVEFVKSLGLKGNILRVVSMAIGMLIFFAFQAKELWPAAAVYIDAFLVTIGGGLSACGYYDFIKGNFVSKPNLTG